MYANLTRVNMQWAILFLLITRIRFIISFKFAHDLMKPWKRTYLKTQLTTTRFHIVT